jgi:hypothetical protein
LTNYREARSEFASELVEVGCMPLGESIKNILAAGFLSPGITEWVNH